MLGPDPTHLRQSAFIGGQSLLVRQSQRHSPEYQPLMNGDKCRQILTEPHRLILDKAVAMRGFGDPVADFLEQLADRLCDVTRF